MKIEYRLVRPEDLIESDNQTFAKMLDKQDKVNGDTKTKAAKCKFVCLVTVDDDVVAIGGIKPKTASDFSHEKAGVPALASEFEWELGYFYTAPSHERRGIGSNIARLLIEAYGDGNLMASTEVSANPGMTSILERHGFRLFGKPWKSSRHCNHLALFLRFE